MFKKIRNELRGEINEAKSFWHKRLLDNEEEFRKEIKSVRDEIRLETEVRSGMYTLIFEDCSRWDSLIDQMRDKISALEKLTASLTIKCEWLEKTQCESYGVAMERVRSMMAHEEKLRGTTVIHLR